MLDILGDIVVQFAHTANNKHERRIMHKDLIKKMNVVEWYMVFNLGVYVLFSIAYVHLELKPTGVKQVSERLKYIENTVLYDDWAVIDRLEVIEGALFDYPVLDNDVVE